MLQVKENSIYQSRPGIEKDWGIPELLEAYDPLPDEPLAERNASILQILPKAEEMLDELSETARLHLDFWKQLAPQRIRELWLSYSTTVTSTYRWELTVNSEGLFYKDVSGEYSNPPGKVSEQLHSDFWFFGPLLPLPDIEARKRVLAAIRNAFRQADSPAAEAHFELFEYPHLENPQVWETGDFYRQDFVTLRHYGTEHGASNWRDGPMYTGFVSFERFLTQPSVLEGYLTPDTKVAIEQHLSRRATRKRAEDVLAPETNAASKRIFMETLGNSQNFHSGAFNDAYRATPAEEEAWRKELIERLVQRLEEEDDEAVLGQLAEALGVNGAANVGDLLCEAAKTALPKAKMAISKLLIERYDPERGVEVHLTLLELEEQDSYWRDYVFRIFFRLRDNRAVQRFVLKCIRGDNEIHFKKAADVLSAWGLLFGDKDFADKEMLRALNWQDACAADPNFTKALEKVVKIIGQ